jgi:predicted nucleic acid-binding protein
MTIERVALDASVLVTATLPDEVEHRSAAMLMAGLNKTATTIAVPALLLPEFTGALRRNGRPITRIREYIRVFRSQLVEIWPVDIVVADIAADIALLQGVKGADSVYLALARLLGIPLVTLDREQRERAPADVEVITPEEALAKWWPE